MRQLTKRLLGGAAGVLAFGTVATALALVVEYKPYGVPDSRRGEYEEKIAEISERNDLLREVPTEQRPIAFVKSATHDFGMLDPHYTATHRFDIENRGGHPLALKVLETTCKCTVGELDHSVVEPGETATITMTWNTGYKAEKYTQTALVETNDPVRKTLELSVKGEVRAEFIVPERIEFKASDPAEQTEANFVVFSQLWEDFTISEIACDIKGFDWIVEPIALGDAELADRDPKSAWRVRMYGFAESYGNYEGEITITAKPAKGGDDVLRTAPYTGRVRAPIAFTGPMLHKSDGMDIGTVVSDSEHQFHVVVRTRGDLEREIKVLDVKPEIFTASMTEVKRSPGTYRLTLAIPEGCPLTMFNSRKQHGFVQVGDPEDERFSNWFPIYGAVVTVKDRLNDRVR